MKVYVLERCYDYEGCTLVGIFSTQAKAEEHKAVLGPSCFADLEIDAVEVDSLCPILLATPNGCQDDSRGALVSFTWDQAQLGLTGATMEYPDDPTEKQTEFTVALVRNMTPAERAAMFASLAEHVCLLCGNDAPCYCAPGYDE